MEIWTLEWSCPSDGETEITLWENEIDALKRGVKEVGDYIQRTFDFDNSNDESCATDVNDMIGRGQYKEAIRRFNDHQDDHNPDYAQYWFVVKKPVHGSEGIKKQVAASTYHSNGATCRGPCKQHNPYANADQSDGTYVCRQCSTFQHIFGTKS